jgi:hypothetical protein
VISGATLSCDQGTSTSNLTVLPTNQTKSDDEPAATVDDYVPMLNILPFGMCQTQSNPQVAAATASAQGVLTPQPCIPVTTSAWSPGTSDVTINGTNALTDDSKCSCTWTGNISVSDAKGTPTIG